MAKRRPISSDTESEGEQMSPKEKPNDVFTMEKILDFTLRRGKEFFLIKWEGYPDEEATWEPRTNILTPTEDLKKQMRSHREAHKLRKRTTKKRKVEPPAKPIAATPTPTPIPIDSATPSPGDQTVGAPSADQHQQIIEVNAKPPPPPHVLTETPAGPPAPPSTAQVANVPRAVAEESSDGSEIAPPEPNKRRRLPPAPPLRKQSTLKRRASEIKPPIANLPGGTRPAAAPPAESKFEINREPVIEVAPLPPPSQPRDSSMTEMSSSGLEIHDPSTSSNSILIEETPELIVQTEPSQSSAAGHGPKQSHPSPLKSDSSINAASAPPVAQKSSGVLVTPTLPPPSDKREKAEKIHKVPSRRAAGRKLSTPHSCPAADVEPAAKKSATSGYLATATAKEYSRKQPTAADSGNATRKVVGDRVALPEPPEPQEYTAAPAANGIDTSTVEVRLDTDHDGSPPAGAAEGVTVVALVRRRWGHPVSPRNFIPDPHGFGSHLQGMEVVLKSADGAEEQQPMITVAERHPDALLRWFLSQCSFTKGKRGSHGLRGGKDGFRKSKSGGGIDGQVSVVESAIDGGGGCDAVLRRDENMAPPQETLVRDNVPREGHKRSSPPSSCPIEYTEENKENIHPRYFPSIFS